MFRSSVTSGKTVTNNNNNNNNSKQSNNNNNDNPPTTIREIRSRHVSASTISSPSRQLSVQRRQAASMERLNSSASTVSSSSGGSTTATDAASRDKGSPSSGSSNSINTSSSPQRGSNSGGLNRTASRVSRFRSAKAVFERLSNNSGLRPEKPSAPEKPTKGTVASRYAAAAAARAMSHYSSNNNNSTSSTRNRFTGGNALSRAQEAGKSASNIEISRTSTNLHNSPSSQSKPQPQPRVNTFRTTTTTSNSSNDLVARSQSKTGASAQAQKSPIQHPEAKPPPKDLIDKIVLEIAKEPQDSDCTIQDLSNCDISGIPETLDFDRCFQDVEMMTEEEARKLLSRKPTPSATLTSGQLLHSNESESEGVVTSSSNELSISTTNHTSDEESKTKQDEEELKIIKAEDTTHQPLEPQTLLLDRPIEQEISLLPEKCWPQTSSNQAPTTIKSRVRFSDEPVKIFDTFAVADYDRRNDDIDPAAASAEYEIEKMNERKGIKDSEDEDDEDNNDNNDLDVATSSTTTHDNDVNSSSKFIQQQQRQRTLSPSNHDNLPHSYDNPHNAQAHDGAAAASHDSSDGNATDHHDHSSSSDQPDLTNKYDDEQTTYSKEYIESLQREINLKHILEQNLRDLQSQFYEAVKKSDEYKSKYGEIEQNFINLSGKLESSQNELSDAQEQSNELEKQLNDIKESSQTLEKKYHRAKRIIKDMQSREQSFNRREQLYQQKLDEIEYELGVLIESIDKTIYEDGLKFFTLTTDNNNINGLSNNGQQKAQLDVFGLVRQMLNNFNSNQSTQNPQIKQRVVSILEQQLANLMISTNGNAPILTNVKVNQSDGDQEPKLAVSNDKLSHYSTTNDSKNVNNNNNRNQSYNYASHRLSQPNLPHPIGVGGQPTKMFHGLNPMPVTMTLNEPSPPHSVNSYPSSNSLNSLNNNNNNNLNNNNNNNIIIGAKLREFPSKPDNHSNLPSLAPSTTAASEEKFAAVTDIQVPFQTNEWHDKLVSEWTTTQVSTWLLALGLDQYISKFEDRNVNGQSLINLDSTVLKGLGVLNSTDRNLLKKKIRELRVEMEKERKLIEKKLKENLKDKSKNKTNGNNRTDNKNDMQQQNKPSWKRGLLS